MNPEKVKLPKQENIDGIFVPTSATGEEHIYIPSFDELLEGANQYFRDSELKDWGKMGKEDGISKGQYVNIPRVIFDRVVDRSIWSGEKRYERRESLRSVITSQARKSHLMRALDGVLSEPKPGQFKKEKQRKIFFADRERWEDDILGAKKVDRYQVTTIPNTSVDGGNPFFVCRRPGRDVEEHVTLGDVLFDHEWGTVYDLDCETTPYLVRKQYFVEMVGSEIARLYDKQIMDFAASWTPRDKIETRVLETYKSILEQRENGAYNRQPGLILERITKNIFKKIEVDVDSRISFQETTVEDDVNRKIDFGLRIDGSLTKTGKTMRVGIQITLGDWEGNTREDKEIKVMASKKRLQEQGTSSGSFEDLAFAVCHVPECHTAYEKWVKNGKPSGGVERYITEKNIFDILSGCLAEFVPTDKINELVLKYIQKHPAQNTKPKPRI